jgi:hydroxymethylpyrimidine/phosphomethylpyrimidine kinase
MTPKKYYRVLTIAGSDSGGGAGIQADLKTFSALGCYGLSAITALTAQNTVAVTGILEVEPQFVGCQIDAVLNDIGVDAVKIGMLSSPEIIAVVAECLRRYRIGNIILDPVMVAKSGDKLLRDEAVQALKEELFPLASIVTPNMPEAEALTGRAITCRADLMTAADFLSDMGPRAVLVKGGHLTDSGSDDFLLEIKDAGRLHHWFESRRIASDNTHGTGCTLSSAIAAYLAKGETVRDAVAKAKEYITGAISAGAAYKLGEGHGPVHHFFKFWP